MSGNGPLRAVLVAFEAGASTVPDVVARTGLARDVVDAAVEHLVRSGRVSARSLTVACPAAGCGGCAAGDGSPGCAAPARREGGTRPVLVALEVRRTAEPVAGGRPCRTTSP